MQIKVDDKIVFELNDIKQRVMQNDVSRDMFGDDIERRVRYIIEYKYQRCFKRLFDEWAPRLAARGMKSIPLDPDEFAQLVFSQPDYRSRDQRDPL